MINNVKTEPSNELKSGVKDHWENETCGTRYSQKQDRKEYFDDLEKYRIQLHPHLSEFADFATGKGKNVLEIGLGTGIDSHNWVRNGANFTGVDLTEAAINLTRERFELNGVDMDKVTLQTADAENLPLPDDHFHIVYSWGVLHHTPNTQKAFENVHRVLKPGGEFRGMVYHVPSWTAWMLWTMHCLLKGKPFKTPKQAVYDHLESPGTKSYTLAEAKELLESAGFTDVDVSSQLTAADLLDIQLSDRYQSPLHKLIQVLYPRWLVRLLGDRFGNALLIKARKSN